MIAGVTLLIGGILKRRSPCSAVSASSGGVCVWGGAETPMRVGNRAGEAVDGVSSLEEHMKT